MPPAARFVTSNSRRPILCVRRRNEARETAAAAARAAEGSRPAKEDTLVPQEDVQALPRRSRRQRITQIRQQEGGAPAAPDSAPTGDARAALDIIAAASLLVKGRQSRDAASEDRSRARRTRSPGSKSSARATAASGRKAAPSRQHEPFPGYLDKVFLEYFAALGFGEEDLQLIREILEYKEWRAPLAEAEPAVQFLSAVRRPDCAVIGPLL